jgi:hypothetical protein
VARVLAECVCSVYAVCAACCGSVVEHAGARERHSCAQATSNLAAPATATPDNELHGAWWSCQPQLVEAHITPRLRVVPLVLPCIGVELQLGLWVISLCLHYGSGAVLNAAKAAPAEVMAGATQSTQ